MRTLEEINAELRELSDKVENAEEMSVEELDEAEKKLSELEEERKTIVEKAEKRSATLEKIRNGLEGTEVESAEERKEDENMNAEYRTAYFKKLLGRELTEAEERAYAQSGAGAVIPEETNDEVITKITKLAPILSEITLLHAKGNIKFAVEGTKNAAGMHTENAAITGDADTLVTVSLAGYEVTKLIQVSKSVETMSVSAFESWLTDMIAGMLAEKLEDLVFNGTGSNQAKGILAESFTTGTNNVQVAKAASLTADNVRTLISYLGAGYDRKAKFAMNKKTLFQAFMPLQDNAKHDLVRESNGKFYVYGYEVLVTDKIADNTAILGDFTKYVGNLNEDINVVKDFDINTNSNKYLGSCIFDGKVALLDAFVTLTKATA